MVVLLATVGATYAGSFGLTAALGGDAPERADLGAVSLDHRWETPRVAADGGLEAVQVWRLPVVQGEPSPDVHAVGARAGAGWRATPTVTFGVFGGGGLAWWKQTRVDRAFGVVFPSEVVRDGYLRGGVTADVGTLVPGLSVGVDVGGMGLFSGDLAVTGTVHARFGVADRRPG